MRCPTPQSGRRRSHGCVWRKGRFAAVFCLLGAQAKAMRAAVQGRSLLRQEQVVVGACRPAAGQPPVKAIFRWAPACMHQRRGRFGTPRTHTQTQADGVLGAAKVQAAVGATRRGGHRLPVPAGDRSSQPSLPLATGNGAAPDFNYHTCATPTQFPYSISPSGRTHMRDADPAGQGRKVRR